MRTSTVDTYLTPLVRVFVLVCALLVLALQFCPVEKTGSGTRDQRRHGSPAVLASPANGVQSDLVADAPR